MMKNRHLSQLGKSLLCLASIAMLLSSCGGTAPTAPATTPPAATTPEATTPASTPSTGARSITSGGNTFVIGQTTDIKQLCPFQTTDTRSNQAIYLISEGLIGYIRDYEIEYLLATSYETSSDGLTWTFHLREGVYFQDGSPFTADDVVFTYESILDPEQKSTQITEYSFIETVEAIDDYTVVFHFNKSYAPALDRFTMAIVSKTYVQANGYDKNAYTNYNPFAIGTGPYKVVDWKPDIALYLEANEDYWGKVPEIKLVEIRPVPDNSVRLASFEVGELDFAFSVDPAEVNRIESSGLYQTFNYPDIRYNYLTWNTQLPLFQDLALRQALTMATNKDEIIDYILYGHGGKASGIFPPNHPYFYDVGEPFPYDLDKAIATLEDAGYTKGSDGVWVSPAGLRCEFETLVMDSAPTSQHIAVLLQARFAELGVKLNIVTQTMDQVYDTMDAVNFGDLPEEAYTSMIGGMTMDVDPDITRTFRSDGSLNDFRYKNPKMDELIDLGVTTFELDKRHQVYNEIQEILANDLPCLWLYHGEVNNVAQSGFNNLSATSYGQIYNMKNITVK